MLNLVRISKVDSDPRIPFRSATFYKWVHLGKHPEIFVKLGKAVFIDLDRFEKMAEAGRVSRKSETI